VANEISYLAESGSDARRQSTPALRAAVVAEIERVGYWEDKIEWRISTETTRRIEPELDERGRRWFKVTVRCDSEMICRAPTLERALEYMGVFERLTRDLFWTLGWPSWAAKTRLEPTAGETTA
jgi:hypothetical protein